MVNHNTKGLTENSVLSILNCKPELDFEIIIVDNSTEAPQKYCHTCKQVRVYPDVPNKGFGNACNFGAKRANGRYLLFLNSDTVMHRQTLEKCLAYMEARTDVGILGVRTLLKNGVCDYSCKRGFPTPAASLYYLLSLDKLAPNSRRFGAYHQTFLNEWSVDEVDAVSGSFLMMPAEIFKNAGGFDETYFMYGEDLDLCYRTKKAGYKVIYYGKAAITHLKGQSGLYTRSAAARRCFYDSMRIFYKKHYQKKYGPFVSAAVYFGIWALQQSARLRKNRKSTGPV